MSNKFNLVFFLASLLIELLFIQFIILNIDGNIPLYMFVYFETFLLFLLGFYLVRKGRISFSFSKDLVRRLSVLTGIQADISVPFYIIITGIVFRLTLAPAALTTSPDAYRYLWEGKVTVNGYNPYRYEPAHPELSHLHSEKLPARIVYKEKKAIYPPAAQYFFAAAYLLSGENFTGLKIIYLVAELLTLFFILKLLYLKNMNLNYVILYAWLPLPVMEYFINAHYDVIGITFLAGFIYFLESGRYIRSAVFFSISFLLKFFPLILFPLLIKKLGLRRTIHFGIISALITLLFYLPFITAGKDLFGFLLLQLERWEFNASFYYLIRIAAGNQGARIICAMLLIVTIIVISSKYKDFTSAAHGIFIAFILFSTTVYPWYLGWPAALNPVSFYYSLTGLLFTINLSNFTPMSPAWTEYTPVLLIEYITFGALLVYDVIKSKNASETGSKI